jgi:hypothetical protein
MIDRIISTVTENMNVNLWDSESRWSELYPAPNLHVCVVNCHVTPGNIAATCNAISARVLLLQNHPQNRGGYTVGVQGVRTPPSSV